MQPGDRLGRYEIVGAIGKGGMGEVWRARDTSLHRDVAIKTLPIAEAGDTDRLARFDREAKLLAALKHPNIASIHGLEESDGMRFLVLELVEGGTLAAGPQHARALIPAPGPPRESSHAAVEGFFVNVRKWTSAYETPPVSSRLTSQS